MPDSADVDVSFQDILDGLARYSGDGFIGAVAAAVARVPAVDLANALNKNQLASKRWLLEELYRALGGDFGTIRILAGWYGVLAAMLLHDPRFRIRTVVSIDRDENCRPIAEIMNRRHLAEHRFRAVTADVLALDYGRVRGSAAPAQAGPDLLVNTSCEHLERFAEWYAALPCGLPLVLQSNDYFDCPEHVNCVSDLTAFRRQAPMARTLYEGALPLKRYTRFMRIGLK